jgi:hypothetical protein
MLEALFIFGVGKAGTTGGVAASQRKWLSQFIRKVNQMVDIQRPQSSVQLNKP